MKLSNLLMVLACGTGLCSVQTSLAQTSMGHPPSTPPTFPTQQQPGTHQKPDESGPLGQVGATSTPEVTKAAADIRTALGRQMPAVADSVGVSLTDDNKIQLTGTVSSDTEKQQVEQIAHSVAPNQSIVNKLNVSSIPSGPGRIPPVATQPKSAGKPPVLQSAAFQQTNSGANAQATPPPDSRDRGRAREQSDEAGTDVRKKIQTALQQDPSLAHANIDVNLTKDNRVELTGTVGDKEQKKTAKQIAETNAGGYKVVDHLKVEHSPENKSSHRGSAPISTPPTFPKQ